jgi:hypothetical protein
MDGLSTPVARDLTGREAMFRPRKRSYAALSSPWGRDSLIPRRALFPQMISVWGRPIRHWLGPKRFSVRIRREARHCLRGRSGCPEEGFDSGRSAFEVKSKRLRSRLQGLPRTLLFAEVTQEIEGVNA